MYLPLHQEDHIQKLIATTGHPYEEEMLERMLIHSEQGDIILDIGANIGNHTLFLASHGRTVLAFEPNSQLTSAIAKSVVINDLGDRVEIFNVAVGAHAGNGKMYIASDSNTGMGRFIEGRGDVKMTTLGPDIVGRPIRAIKIDVEGMEASVLAGAKALIGDQTPDLYIEIAEQNQMAEILNGGYLKGYFYVDTFNNTATHLFRHESRFTKGTTHMPIADETIFALAAAKKASLSLQDRFNRQVAALATQEGQLQRARLELATLEGQLQRAQLASRNIARELDKYRKRYKTAVTVGLILGAPVITLLSPLIVLGYGIKKLREPSHTKRSGRLRALFKFAEKTESLTQEPMLPAALDARYSKPLKSIPKPNAQQSLVSIIIPTFNREKYLARAIRSVQAQSHTNLEIIVVDDGSGDASVAVATQIAKGDPRVRVVSMLRNFGCYYARNVGVMHARGQYIGICDSDDLIAPDRLKRQVASIEEGSGILACLSRIRRWTEDYVQPLNTLKYGENTLLWRRELLDDIGWFDTCRFGADSEFRERLIARHGKGAIAYIPDELYFLRSSQDSLALSGSTAAYDLQGSVLEKKLSPERQNYQYNFQAWHSRLAPSDRIEFPQFGRSFELGCQEQNASPSLGQRRIGAMASFPKRRESLRQSLATLLPQLDELILYLNDYENIPYFCQHPKLRIVLGKSTCGDLRDNGKYFDLPKDNCSYVFTFDDDIIYPADYVQRMIHYIEMFDRRAVVGVHGVIFPERELTDLVQRTVYGFRFKHHGAFVDLLGTGTTGWHSSALKPELDHFPTKGVCDLWFARLATEAEMPLFNVPREKDWLRPIEGNDTNLFAEAKERPEGYFKVYEQHLAPLLRLKQSREMALAQLRLQYTPAAIEAAMGHFLFSR